MTARELTSAQTPTAASVLALVQSIKRHGPYAPAALAFRSALRRKGIEVDHAGGLATLKELLSAVAHTDPERADVRTMIVRSARLICCQGRTGEHAHGCGRP